MPYPNYKWNEKDVFGRGPIRRILSKIHSALFLEFNFLRTFFVIWFFVVISLVSLAVYVAHHFLVKYW